MSHTPGPWAWFGNASSNSIYLATTHSGRRYVMDFVRWGMRGAQPRFQPALTNEAYRNMIGGKGHLIDNARAAIAKAEGTGPDVRYARAKVSA
ncbi:hypothetical protein HFO77_23230 [Rhizobium leguminosarum]|uniref:hypothetical protein n=1 Tax=Rhizobium leguminosarum TaxID=384 RepID=UPI001C98C729|nr:hypothetical protein [Rhizobium leguminosarum]MBY5917310.1 hypothetical protein [Rhizobium leguminosarum]